jgi:hypothetical protein
MLRDPQDEQNVTRPESLVNSVRGSRVIFAGLSHALPLQINWDVGHGGVNLKKGGAAEQGELAAARSSQDGHCLGIDAVLPPHPVDAGAKSSRDSRLAIEDESEQTVMIRSAVVL